MSKKPITVSLNDMGMPKIPKNTLNGNELNINMKNIDIETNPETHVDNMNIILNEN